ncbi:MAG: Zn-dependent exopeptidase M28, partial [Spirochaetaceae bacterium]|nr:Zn-dependent exopeptidase M28 [Spirochaetaceae bacterium]
KEGTVNSANPAPPYHRFKDFIDIRNDRFNILTGLLNELKFSASVVNIGGKRHIFVVPAPNILRQGSKRTLTVFAAHYDRVPDSPGANDNGAAVFILIDAALRLRGHASRDWMIIFTDKEELSENEGLRDQGAYLLAKGLKRIGLKSCRFFIFDACGRGDTLIISKTASDLLKNEHSGTTAPLKNQLRLLQLYAMEAAKSIPSGHFLLLPTPFSDDAGFLRAGLAAQTITVLPAKEAAAFLTFIRGNDLYIGTLISSEERQRRGVEHVPQTWRLLNSPEDTAAQLDGNNFKNITKFIIELCRRDKHKF